MFNRDRKWEFRDCSVVNRIEFNPPREILHLRREDRVDFGSDEGGEHDKLPDMSCIIIQVPGSNAAEITAVRFFWLEIEML